MNLKTDLNLRCGFAGALTKRNWGAWDWTNPEPIPSAAEITVNAARNQVAGFQVRLLADQDYVLLLDHTNWLHPLGFRPRVRLSLDFPSLPAGALETFPVGYLPGDDHRLWMETLQRSGYSEVPAGRTQAVYVRLRLAAGFEPGEHAGQVRAFTQYGFEDEALSWQGTVRLQLHAATLPDVADWTFHLDLWQHHTALARYHGVALWSDAHFALIDRYLASLAQLGQKAVSAVVAEIPWSGQSSFRDPGYPSYLFEHAIVDVHRDEAGRLGFDFSQLDRLLALAKKHGLDRQIDLFGLLNVWTDEEYGFGKVAPDAPDAMRVRCYDHNSGAITYLRSAAELRLFLAALHDHLESLGLLERVRIAADEPSDLAKFNASLAFIKEAAPGFRYTAYINHFEFITGAPQEVSDFVPILPLACRDPQLTSRLTEQVHARGGRMLWYVCCWPPLPNTFLHSPLVEGQLLGWLTHYFRLDGFVRWAFCLWPADPWRRVSWRAPGWSAGDMYFVLPGKDGAPVETLRYEALRAAAQDFELLKLAERTLPAGQAQTVIERAFQCFLRAGSAADFADVATVKAEALYSLDGEDYEEARRLVLTALAEPGLPEIG